MSELLPGQCHLSGDPLGFSSAAPWWRLEVHMRITIQRAKFDGVFSDRVSVVDAMDISIGRMKRGNSRGGARRGG